MWVCAAQQGRDFEAPDLELSGVSISEAFSRTGSEYFERTESFSFVSSHLKLFKDRLLLKIRFNALTRKLLYSRDEIHTTLKFARDRIVMQNNSICLSSQLVFHQ